MKSKWMLVTSNLTTVLSVDSTSMTISHHYCHWINTFEISTCMSHIMQHPQRDILEKVGKTFRKSHWNAHLQGYKQNITAFTALPSVHLSLSNVIPWASDWVLTVCCWPQLLLCTLSADTVHTQCSVPSTSPAVVTGHWTQERNQRRPHYSHHQRHLPSH